MFSELQNFEIMLLIIHTKAYQDFLNLLFQLQNQYQNSEQISKKQKNQAIWANLKQVFQQRIVPLTDEDLETEVANRWLSLQTEIQREFRLLNTDWLFLESSRQPATKEARKKTVLKRLHKLISYCQVMLTL